jgi:hypothetical protein
MFMGQLLLGYWNDFFGKNSWAGSWFRETMKDEKLTMKNDRP